LREGDSIIDDWKILRTRFEEELSRTEKERFKEAVFALTKWTDVDRVNVKMLRSLN